MNSLNIVLLRIVTFTASSCKMIFIQNLLLNSFKILLIILLLTIIYFSRTFLYWRSRNIPYILPIPIFGNFYKVLTLQKDVFHFAIDLYREVSHNYFGIWIFDKPMLIIKVPELIKMILVKDFDHFEERTVTLNPKIDSIGSKMLFFAKGTFWKVARKKITTEFNLEKHKNLIPLMHKSLDKVMELNFKQHYEGRSIDAKEVFQGYSASILATCIFGTDLDSANDFKNIGQNMFNLDFNNALRGTSHFFLPALPNLFKISFAKQEVYDSLQKMLLQTMEERINEGLNKDTDYVDALIKIEEEFLKENDFSNDSSRPAAYAIQFFLAGIESISSSIAFTLYELCLNLEIQNKLRAEILEGISNSGNVNYQSLMAMKYLHNCISETLRKYPTLPFIDRRCTKRYQIPGTETIIEKGTPVYIFLLGVHYDPQYFPDPENYNPDRFNEDIKEQRHQYAYLAFGYGPHSCIGKRFSMIAVKLALVTILSKFEVRRNENTPVPLQFDPRCFLLKTKSGLPMTFRKLKND